MTTTTTQKTNLPSTPASPATPSSAGKRTNNSRTRTRPVSVSIDGHPAQVQNSTTTGYCSTASHRIIDEEGGDSSSSDEGNVDIQNDNFDGYDQDSLNNNGSFNYFASPKIERLRERKRDLERQAMAIRLSSPRYVRSGKDAHCENLVALRKEQEEKEQLKEQQLHHWNKDKMGKKKCEITTRREVGSRHDGVWTPGLPRKDSVGSNIISSNVGGNGESISNGRRGRSTKNYSRGGGSRGSSRGASRGASRGGSRSRSASARNRMSGVSVGGVSPALARLREQKRNLELKRRGRGVTAEVVTPATLSTTSPASTITAARATTQHNTQSATASLATKSSPNANPPIMSPFSQSPRAKPPSPPSNAITENTESLLNPAFLQSNYSTQSLQQPSPQQLVPQSLSQIKESTHSHSVEKILSDSNTPTPTSPLQSTQTHLESLQTHLHCSPSQQQQTPLQSTQTHPHSSPPQQSPQAETTKLQSQPISSQHSSYERSRILENRKKILSLRCMASWPSSPCSSVASGGGGDNVNVGVDLGSAISGSGGAGDNSVKVDNNATTNTDCNQEDNDVHTPKRLFGDYEQLNLFPTAEPTKPKKEEDIIVSKTANKSNVGASSKTTNDNTKTSGNATASPATSTSASGSLSSKFQLGKFDLNKNSTKLDGDETSTTAPTHASHDGHVSNSARGRSSSGDGDEGGAVSGGIHQSSNSNSNNNMAGLSTWGVCGGGGGGDTVSSLGSASYLQGHGNAGTVISSVEIAEQLEFLKRQLEEHGDTLSKLAVEKGLVEKDNKVVDDGHDVEIDHQNLRGNSPLSASSPMQASDSEDYEPITPAVDEQGSPQDNDEENASYHDALDEPITEVETLQLELYERNIQITQLLEEVAQLKSEVSKPEQADSNGDAATSGANAKKAKKKKVFSANFAFGEAKRAVKGSISEVQDLETEFKMQMETFAEDFDKVLADLYEDNEEADTQEENGGRVSHMHGKQELETVDEDEDSMVEGLHEGLPVEELKQSVEIKDAVLGKLHEAVLGGEDGPNEEMETSTSANPRDDEAIHEGVAGDSLDAAELESSDHVVTLPLQEDEEAKLYTPMCDDENDSQEIIGQQIQPRHSPKTISEEREPPRQSNPFNSQYPPQFIDRLYPFPQHPPQSIANSHTGLYTNPYNQTSSPSNSLMINSASYQSFDSTFDAIRSIEQTLANQKNAENKNINQIESELKSVREDIARLANAIQRTASANASVQPQPSQSYVPGAASGSGKKGKGRFKSLMHALSVRKRLASPSKE